MITVYKLLAPKELQIYTKKFIYTKKPLHKEMV